MNSVFRVITTYFCPPRYMRGSSVNIQTPTRCNLIACSMTSPPPVLSPSSILPPPSSLTAFSFTQRGEKNRIAFKKYYFSFLYVFKNGVNLKQCKSKSVCTARAECLYCQGGVSLS
jgi:hypothetical protein